MLFKEKLGPDAKELIQRQLMKLIKPFVKNFKNKEPVLEKVKKNLIEKNSLLEMKSYIQELIKV